MGAVFRAEVRRRDPNVRQEENTMRKKPAGDAWSDAWTERYPEPSEERPRRSPLKRLSLKRGSRTGRYAVLASVVIAVVAAPFAVAAGKGSFVAKDSRYTVLARNTSNGDGGALAAACTSNASTPNNAHEPCLNMVNKGTGYAAAFRTRGVQGFRLQTSGSGTATPFILDKNATGKVTYFNADQLDGKDSTDFNIERWGLIDGTTNPTPTIVRNKGITGVARTTGAPAGDYTVTFADDVNNCTFQVTPANATTARTVSAVPVSGQNKQVRVTVRDASGGGTGALADDSFQIAAHC
jgi:hypothetical protein